MNPGGASASSVFRLSLTFSPRMNLSYLKKKIQFTFLKILKTSSTVQVKVRLGRFQLNGGINHRNIVPQTKEVVFHNRGDLMHGFTASVLLPL